MIETLALYAPEAQFVEPYIKAALPGVSVCGIDDDAADMALMISSTDIYGPEAHDMTDETATIDAGSVWKMNIVESVPSPRRILLKKNLEEKHHKKRG